MEYNLVKEIEAYQPYNEQEEKDKEYMLHAMKNQDFIYTRDNKMVHMTASAWIVNKERTKVLMAYHKIYDSWAWLGGHADGEENLLAVALKEAKEESGISNIKPVSDSIFSLEVLTVDGHMKKDTYISSHLHLNITYLLEADENDVLTVKEDENSGLCWFRPEEALEVSTEPWFIERVYKKLNDKVNLILT